jgi:hypothetical protein
MPAPRLVAAGGLEVTKGVVAGAGPRRGDLVVPEAAAAVAGVSVQSDQQGDSDPHQNRERARRARSKTMIGHGRLLIESSPSRDASPTLLAKADGARRTARRERPAGRRRQGEREQLTAAVRTVLSAISAQGRPRRQVRS